MYIYIYIFRIPQFGLKAADSCLQVPPVKPAKSGSGTQTLPQCRMGSWVGESPFMSIQSL